MPSRFTGLSLRHPAARQHAPCPMHLAPSLITPQPVQRIYLTLILMLLSCPFSKANLNDSNLGFFNPVW